MEYQIAFGKSNVPATYRPGKGNSIITFPDEYCMVDLETTGLSSEWNDIIEIGAIRYRDGKVIDRFQTLVQPPISDDGTYVDSFIEELTGITNEMLATAPLPRETLPRFLEFVKNSIILGYNVSFDIRFLYDKCAKYLTHTFSNDYVDVMRLANKIHPELPHHRLKDMVAFYNLTNEKEHRTISDCEATEQVYRKLCNEGLERFGSYEEIIRSFYSKKGKWASVKASNIVADPSKVSPDCPLYQRHCVITGKLDRFTRAEAMQLIADIGGINDNTVTKNTNYLILGNNDYCTTIKGGKSSKQKKAEAYKLNGQDIDIIPETVFYDMIADCVIETENMSIAEREEDNEQTVADHFSAVIKSVNPDAEITLEQRSENYLSFCVAGIDILRIKYTSKAKWISIDAWSAKIEKDDPRFEAQANKLQRHWKAHIQDISSLSAFDDLVIKACQFDDSQTVSTQANSLVVTDCPIFGDYSNDAVYNTIQNMIGRDEENVCLKELKSSTAIYMFNTNAFTIIINERTKCIKTNVKVALDFADKIGCATVKDKTLSVPLNCGLEYFDAVKEMVNAIYQYRQSLVTGDQFLCCNDFEACSDNLECVKKDDPYYRGCLYRKNLESGKIFYGKNKNA